MLPMLQYLIQSELEPKFCNFPDAPFVSSVVNEGREREREKELLLSAISDDVLS